MPTEFGSNDYRLPIDIEEGTDDAIWDLLSLYADGEATPEQAAEVEALLCADPRVARDLQFLRATGETVQTFTEMEPPAALRDAIFAATTRRQTVAARLLAFWGDVRQTFAPRSRYAMTLGGLAAASLLAVALWPHSQTASIPNQKSPGVEIASHPAVSPSSRPTVGSEAVLPNNSRVEKPAVAANTLKSSDHPASMTRFVSVKNPVMPPLHPTAPNTGAGGNKPKPADQNHPSTTAGGGSESAPVNIPPDNDANNRHMASRTSPPMPITSGVDDPSVKSDLAANTTSPDNARPINEPAPRLDAKVQVVKLPPETYDFLTNAQMKKQLDAKTLGYDRDTVKSIQRKELTVSLIKGSL